MSERTCSKWGARYRAEGEAGLLDRSSAPRSVSHRTSEQRVDAIAALRRLRMTAAETAECVPIPRSNGSSREHTSALDGWLCNHNHRHAHNSLRHQPLIARLNELNNVARSYG